MNRVSVIIPVYKELDVFARNLAHNIPLLRGSEVIVVNDDPSVTLPTGPCEEIETVRTVRWINNTANTGFGPAVNVGASHARGEYLFLLNSDVILLDDTWHTALEAFEDERVFAVGLAQRERDGSLVGRNELSYSRGLFHHRALSFDSARISQHSSFLSTAWAEGGSMIARASMWRTLGGFDPVYAPFYWEDIDLSYRACLRGWKVLFAPQIVVEHHHESTIRSHFEKGVVKAIAFRNQLTFTGRHARGLRRIISYLFRYFILPLRGYRTW